MSIIEKHLSFVKEQQALQEKLARKYQIEPWRAELHAKTAARFAALADDLLLLQHPSAAQPAKEVSPSSIFVTAKDVEGLPPELLRELSLSDIDKLEFTIAGVIEGAGGVLSLDKLLIAIFRRTGEVVKRNALISRLYRMAQRNQIFSVPGKKGVYATRPFTEETARRLVGRDEAEPDEESASELSDPKFSLAE